MSSAVNNILLGMHYMYGDQHPYIFVFRPRHTNIVSFMIILFLSFSTVFVSMHSRIIVIYYFHLSTVNVCNG